jgi:hypothetical protein
VYPLSDSLNAYPDRTLYLIDWGLFENLNLLHQGRLNLQVSYAPQATDSASPEELGRIRQMLQDPDALVLDHVREQELFPNVGVRLEGVARSLGYRKEVVRTIPDSNGRPMFEIVRFVGGEAE